MGAWIYLIAPVSIVIMFLLFRNPELPLAILFSGTLFYFYVVYKLHYETNATLTGGFYGLLGFSSIVGGIFKAQRRSNKIRVETSDIMFWLFFLFITMSYLLFSFNSEEAFSKIRMCPFLVIMPYLGMRLLNSKEMVETFYRYCIQIILMLGIVSFYELSTNIELSSFKRFSIYLLNEGGNPIVFGTAFGSVFIILMIYFFEKSKRKYYIILMLMSLFFVFRSGSRGALISLLATIAFYPLAMAKVKATMRIYILILMTFLIPIIYRYIPQDTADFYKYSISEEAKTDDISSIKKRRDAMNEAIQDFKKNMFFGIGFGKAGTTTIGTTFPHNIIIEILSELGLFGLFIFSLFCYTIVRKAWVCINIVRDKNLNIYMKIAFLLFFYSLVEALFSGQVANQTQLFMSMALMVSISKLKTVEAINKTALN